MMPQGQYPGQQQQQMLQQRGQPGPSGGQVMINGAIGVHPSSPPSVPLEELTAMGIRYISCDEVGAMLEARQRGQSIKSFAIVDLRSFDYAGGHINGGVNISSSDLIRDVRSPGVD